MSLRRTILLATTLTALLLTSSPTVLQAAAMGYPQEPEKKAEQETPSAPGALTVEAIELKIKSIEEAKELDEVLKGKVLEAYRQALSRLKDAQDFKIKAKAYADAIQEAPDKTDAIRQRLAATTGTDAQLDPAFLKDKPVGDLETILNQEQSNLTQLKNGLAELEKQIKDEQDLPAKAGKQQTEARGGLVEHEQSLKAAPPADENPLLTEAIRTALEARKGARTEEINMLDQALLSREPRLNLVTAQRDETQLQVGQTQQRIKELEAVVNERRKAEAEEASAEAKQASEEARGKDQVVKDLAEGNEELGEEWVQLESWINEATEAGPKVEGSLNKIKAALENARDRLELTGFSGKTGEFFLRDQRKDLDEALLLHRKKERGEKERLFEGRLRKLKIGEELRSLGNMEDAVLRIMEERLKSGEEPAVSEKELEEEIRKQLTAKKALLDKLFGAYEKCYSLLTNLETKRRELELKILEFARFLDERLLWLPSALAVNWETLVNLETASRWFLDGSAWMETGKLLLAQGGAHPFRSVLAALALAAMIIFRRKMLHVLEDISAKVGKVSVDRLGLTLKALILTVLLIMFWPLLMGYTGWLISTAAETPDFAKSLSTSLLMVAMPFAVLLFFRFLCRMGGVASIHFKWSETTLAVLRRNLLWFTAVLIPTLFILFLVESQQGSIYRASLGRLAQVVAAVALSVFLQRILRTRGGVTEQFLAAHPQGWLARLRFLWYPLAVGYPAALALLALMGYQYTAHELGESMVETFYLILGIVVARALVLRWLRVAERKLKLSQMRQKLEAARAARDEEGEEDEGELPVDLDEDELDLDTINEQSRKLLRTVVIISVVIGLWMVWAEVLPALKILEEVELWKHSVLDEEGGSKFQPVSLADLIMAFLVAVITAVAARNLPGVMEIAILQRLPMDRGSRYAMTTITSYIIVGVGIVVGFNTIGVRWAQVQWLIAALGVGLGFGLQEIFANFMSGLIILFERPIRVGDTVTVGNVDGIVTRIRIRATTITNWDRKELIIPNKTFITGELINWTLSDSIVRIIVPVGIAYGSDTALAQKLLEEAADKNPWVMDDPKPMVHFMGFGDSSLNFEIRIFLQGTGNLLSTRHELHLAIDSAFRKNGIEISFPQRDLHLRSAETSIRIEGKEVRPPEEGG